MTDRTPDQQLVSYLTDVHSIEVQALAQMRAAPKIAGDDRLADIFATHLEETEEQEQRVRALLEAHGADPSTLKDIAGRAGGWAMVAFAKLNPDTPGKLVAHAYSYEHMEIAAYELLARAARRTGDETVVAGAEAICAQEREMAHRLEQHFDVAVEASLRAKDAEDIEQELVSYLRDAHALESQAQQLLQSGPKLVDVAPLAEVFREHLAETEDHLSLVEERLRAHESKPSRFQSTALKAGAMNLGGFFGAQPDTPVKLAGFAYAFEHLEVAGYELLARVAQRAGDQETVAIAQKILDEERRAASLVCGTWDAVMDATVGRYAGRS